MRHSVRLGVALSAALVVAAAGCVHMKTHDSAPPIERPEQLADFVAARLPERPAWRAGRAAKVAITYKQPVVNPLGTGERIATELVPLWPYGRGEWPAPEIVRLRPVIERLLAPHAPPGGAPAGVLLELRFAPPTYRRYTRTVYGLSLFSHAVILGYPTDFATVRLEADLRVRRLEGERPTAGAPPLLERRIAAENTANGGTLLWMFPYNRLVEKRLWFFGDRPLRWDDVFAGALVEFAEGILAALPEAFPARCAACDLWWEGDLERCEACGGDLAPAGKPPARAAAAAGAE